MILNRKLIQFYRKEVVYKIEWKQMLLRAHGRATETPEDYPFIWEDCHASGNLNQAHRALSNQTNGTSPEEGNKVPGSL